MEDVDQQDHFNEMHRQNIRRKELDRKHSVQKLEQSMEVK
jgi:hypothetical protein